MRAPNAHALSFRNRGDVGDDWSISKQKEGAQPGAKTPAREYDGGESASKKPAVIKGGEWETCETSIVLLICARGNKSNSSVIPTLGHCGSERERDNT